MYVVIGHRERPVVRDDGEELHLMCLRLMASLIIRPLGWGVPHLNPKEDRANAVGQIVIRPMNYLALSYDHRIIDGREAVLSLIAMKDVLEDPARLLLDL